MGSRLSPGGENPSFAASEDFLNLEEAPDAQEVEVQWESYGRPGSEQQVRKHKKKEDTGGEQRQPRAQHPFAPQSQSPLQSQSQSQSQSKTKTKPSAKAQPRLGRRPSFEYEDYKRDAYDRMSVFDDDES